MSEQDNENQSQELGVLGKKLQKQKGPKPKKFIDEDEENQENPQINPITGEIDSTSIQNAQHNNSFLYTLFPGFNMKSMTCGLIFLFLAIYIFVAYKASQLELPVGHKMKGQIQDTFVTLEMGCVLQRNGGRFTPFLHDSNAYWRLITSNIVHGDIMQLSVNIFSLMLLGYQLESYLGSKKFGIIFFTAGTFGNLAAQFFHRDQIYSGACQCIFALYGMQAYNMKEHFAYMGENRKKLGKHFLWVILATFFLFLLDNEIDFLALPASLIIGFLLAWFMNRDLYEKPVWLIVSIIALLVYIGSFVWQINQSSEQAEYPCDVWDHPKEE